MQFLQQRTCWLQDAHSRDLLIGGSAVIGEPQL